MRTMRKLLTRTLPALQALVPPRPQGGSDPDRPAQPEPGPGGPTGLGEPEPRRVLDQPERPMGYVDPQWISPVIREYFPYNRWRRLSPYFEHTEYAIFVEARPYADLVERFPDEDRMYQAGNLWGMSYSTSCVRGEEGHHHMSVLRPITPERFEAARAAGWDL